MAVIQTADSSTIPSGRDVWASASSLAGLPVHRVRMRPETTVHQIETIFASRPETPAVMVGDETGCSDLISRMQLERTLSLPFHREVFCHRPVRELCRHLNHRPLRLPSATPLYYAVEAALSRPQQHLYDPILVDHPEHGPGIIEIHVLLMAQSRQLREQVDAHRRMQDQLAFDARHDALTRLPNRVALHDQLALALERRRSDPRCHFALFFLDFDRFKLINDTHGHQAGDEFLCRVADRLRRFAWEIGSEVHGLLASVARLGGDEFTCLIEGPEAARLASSLAERAQTLLAEPYDLAAATVASSASIGIVTSLLPLHAVGDILRDADIALYKAKDQGRACHVLFTDQMLQETHDSLNLIGELNKALEQRQLELWYQPLVCLADASISGFEALIRWNHPTRGMISPSRIIPLAEETGVIVPIGWWVIETACARLADWTGRLGGRGADCHVSINVSKRQLIEPDVAARLADVLRRFRIAPDRLKLEITESCVSSDDDRVTRTLNQLRERGLSLWMDDFGTGASSLSCLRRYPFDMLKLDRQFIRDMGRGVEHTAITHAAITLAHNLGRRVVAEGVENTDQLAQLLALDADLAQGYLFSHPVTADRAERLLTQETPLWHTDRSADALLG